MKDIRVEPAALAALSVVTATLAAALVAVLLGSGVPVALLLAGGLLLTGPPSVWLLVRVGRRQELERERAKVAALKDGPSVQPQDGKDGPAADGPKALNYS